MKKFTSISDRSYNPEAMTSEFTVIELSFLEAQEQWDEETELLKEEKERWLQENEEYIDKAKKIVKNENIDPMVMSTLEEAYEPVQIVSILENGNYTLYEGCDNIVKYYVCEVLKEKYRANHSYWEYYDQAYKYQNQYPELSFHFNMGDCVLVW